MPFTRPESAQRISHTPDGDPDGKTYFIPDEPVNGTHCPEIEFELEQGNDKGYQIGSSTPMTKVPSA